MTGCTCHLPLPPVISSSWRRRRSSSMGLRAVGPTDGGVCISSGRRRGCRSSRLPSLAACVLSTAALIGVVLVVGPSSASAESPSTSTEHVCSSLRMQNFVSNLRKLENCTVIEGSLQIVLIENSSPRDFEALSFPLLREVTSYVLLYRVYGLRSLSKLFPNLAVIRGQILFYNYALVVVEVPDMLDIGLGSLTRIVRGAVRIEKNPQLCYTTTVDWPAVTGVHRREHFIVQNKDPSQCANTCPSHHTCPHNTEILDNGDVVSRALCWNANHCQKVCPPNCTMQAGGGACYQVGSEVRCCHPECFGGCWGPRNDQCTACVNVTYRGQCLSQCPNNTYIFMNRRCVTEAECRAVRFGNNPVRFKMIVSVGVGLCVPECPPKYSEDPNDRHLCVLCPGHCPKVCGGLVVHNIAAAQRYKGCTIIKGSVSIEISGGFKVNEELEENLGMIEEVQTYVKVSRSYPITSLRFLKSLRVIHGEGLFNHRYALLVYHNENLQDTWDLSTMNLTVARGSIFFQLNPKLCINKVYSLVNHLGMTQEVDTTDIYPESNGNDVSCYTNVLTLELRAVTSRGAHLRWKKLNTTASQTLLSWVVNYRPTFEENITLSSARDTCNGDLWKSVDVTNQLSNSTEMGVLLHDLEPFTKYAVYVLSYSTMMSKTSAMSQMLYFRTDPAEPSPARNVTAVPRYPGELHVSWKEPSSPNGNVTHYYIYWQIQPLYEKSFEQRNYCEDKLRMQSKPKPTEAPATETSTNTTAGGSSGGQCCKCPKSKQELEKEEEEQHYQTEFENFLLKSLYTRKPVNVSYENIRLGVSTSLSTNPTSSLPVTTTLSTFEPPSVWSSLRPTAMQGNLSTRIPVVINQPYEAAIVYGQREIVLTNLKHYQEYNIEVVACQDHDTGHDSKACSNRAIVSARTLPDSKADEIDPHNITVANGTDLLNSVWIRWTDPPAPNGLIVLYDVELTRVDAANYKPDIYCIPHRQFRLDEGYVSQSLAAGNWSVRIRATSLAGNGSWTERKYFVMAHPEVVPVPLSAGALAGVVISCVIVAAVVLVLLAVWIYRKRLDMAMNEDRLYVLSANPQYAMSDEVYIPDEWEVPREKIKVGRPLGQGSFGMVYEGTAIDVVKGQPKIKVAIKTVNENAARRDRIAFLNEASVMKRFDCAHVVKLLGVVSVTQPPLVVMELMHNGDLKGFLRALRPEEKGSKDKKPLTLAQMLQMAGEIADGMAYLASVKFVHRDLAARNCMVTEHNSVKIGDFGMARDIYVSDYYRKDTQGLLPVRWMSPESLHDGIFITASDVWSYGIVLWEMVTLAEQPYQGQSNEEVLHYVCGGRILDRPDNCPDILYQLMVQCWHYYASRRPTFIDILDFLEPHLSDAFRAISFYHNPPPPPERSKETGSNGDDNSSPSSPEILSDIPPPLPTTSPPHSPDEVGLLSGQAKIPDWSRWSSDHPKPAASRTMVDLADAKPTTSRTVTTDPVSSGAAYPKPTISRTLTELAKPISSRTAAESKPVLSRPSVDASLIKPLLAETSFTNRDGMSNGPRNGDTARTEKDCASTDGHQRDCHSSSGVLDSAGNESGYTSVSGGGAVSGRKKNGFVNGHVIPYNCLPEARC